MVHGPARAQDRDDHRRTLPFKWEAPDTLTAVFEFPGDFMVTFTGAVNSSVDDGGIEFRGSEATLKIDREHLAVYPEGGKWVRARRLRNPKSSCAPSATARWTT